MTPTPRGGGVAVVLGIVAGASAVLPGYRGTAVVGGVMACASIGLLEDLRGVSIKARLLAQAAVGMSVAVLLVAGPGLTKLVTAGMCALAYVAVVNAVNFMDGINGITSAQAVIGGGAYALLGLLTAHMSLVAPAILTAAAMAAFAPFNVPQAKVFLGDSGSYGIGAALAGLALLALTEGLPVEAALGPLAVYLADTGTAIVRRVAANEAWYRPHRSHVYQRLTTAGFSHARVSAGVAALVAVTSTLGAVSVVGSVFARGLADAACLAVVAGYLASPGLMARRMMAVS